MSKELKIDIPEGYEIDQKNSTFERIMFKKKHTYPKSWEEFCENCQTTDKEYYICSDSEIFDTCNTQNRDCDEDRNNCKTKEEAEAFLALMQLKRLWHEYVDNYSEKLEDTYYIACFRETDGIEFNVYHSISLIETFLFKFPSKELAKEFLNNFEDLFMKIIPLFV